MNKSNVQNRNMFFEAQRHYTYTMVCFNEINTISFHYTNISRGPNQSCLDNHLFCVGFFSPKIPSLQEYPTYNPSLFNTLMERSVYFPQMNTLSHKHLVLNRKKWERCDNKDMGNMTKDRRRASKS